MKEFNKTQELLKLKIKQNKNTYIKRISIILSCVILVIGVLYFTFAKFESNKSYTLIQGKLGDYSSGDLTIGAIIDGVSSSSFPENNGKYNLSKIECTNEEGALNVEYDKSTWEITKLALTSKTKCTAYFNEMFEWAFEYTGTPQEFKVFKSGNYKIELWGAQGGGLATSNNYSAYTSGIINLNPSDSLYIYVGEYGYGDSNASSSAKYNGGGQGRYNYISGGGATDIRYFNEGNPTDSDLEVDSELGLRSRIMVAAGGGSQSFSSLYTTAGTSAAGGLSGYNGGYASAHGNVGQFGRGGTQTGGGSAGSNIYSGTGASYSGSFGIGGNSTGATGGGGGYFGGGAGGNTGSGGAPNGAGGGSSFISGHTGCVAITSSSSQSPRTGTNGATCSTGTSDNLCSVHYSGIKFTNTKMIDGLGYSWTNTSGAREAMPKPEGGYYSDGVGHNGNGYARITYLGE